MACLPFCVKILEDLPGFEEKWRASGAVALANSGFGGVYQDTQGHGGMGAGVWPRILLHDGPVSRMPRFLVVRNLYGSTSLC